MPTKRTKKYVVANPRGIPQKGDARAPVLTNRSGAEAVTFYEGDAIKPSDIAAFDHYLKTGFIVEAD